jgi:hypothetical protein
MLGAASDFDFSDIALVNPLKGFFQAVIGAALSAGLDDAIIFASGLDELSALPDVVGNGLFQIDILAGLAGPHAHERMPMIGSGDGDNIDVFIIEHFPEVLVACDESFLILKFAHASCEHVVVHIAERDDAHALLGHELADVRATAALEADDRDAKVGVGAFGLTPDAGLKAD